LTCAVVLVALGSLGYFNPGNFVWVETLFDHVFVFGVIAALLAGCALGLGQQGHSDGEGWADHPAGRALTVILATVSQRVSPAVCAVSPRLVPMAPGGLEHQ
jgi:hypothetical protein